MTNLYWYCDIDYLFTLNNPFSYNFYSVVNGMNTLFIEGVIAALFFGNHYVKTNQQVKQTSCEKGKSP